MGVGAGEVITLELVCQKGREISGLLCSPNWRRAKKYLRDRILSLFTSGLTKGRWEKENGPH